MEPNTTKYEPGLQDYHHQKDEDVASDVEFSSASYVTSILHGLNYEADFMRHTDDNLPKGALVTAHMELEAHTGIRTEVEKPSQNIFRFISVGRRKRVPKAPPADY